MTKLNTKRIHRDLTTKVNMKAQRGTENMPRKSEIPTKDKPETCIEGTKNTQEETLIENPIFLTKNFQLNDICNYVSTRFFYFLNKIMEITN